MIILLASTYLYGEFDYVLVMSHKRFRVDPHSKVALMSRNFLLETGAKPEV